MNKSRTAARAVLALALIAGLQGCVELAVGGALVGAVAASDRRTLGAQTEDAAINLKGESRVAAIVGDAGHVNVTSFNRRVLLTGEVRDEAMRQAVVREMRAVEAVVDVTDDLAIAGPSSYTSRSSDAFITTRVKAGLVENKDVAATSVKVVTERGNVYLMGRVTQREGEIATEVARSVPGVQKVVKVFEYINAGDVKAPAR